MLFVWALNTNVYDLGHLVYVSLYRLLLVCSWNHIVMAVALKYLLEQRNVFINALLSAQGRPYITSLTIWEPLSECTISLASDNFWHTPQISTHRNPQLQEFITEAV